MSPAQFLAPTPRLAVPPPHALRADPPVLRLVDLGLGPGRLSFDVHPGEIVHVQGGSQALRLRLLALAAGHGAGDSGRCELLGHDLQRTDGPALRALRDRHIGRVLAGDTFPATPTVLDGVAQPLCAQGLPLPEARARAALDLDALGAAQLAQRAPGTLDRGEARLALIARATAPRPRLLVLQDPETALVPPVLSAVRLALWALSSAFETCVLMTTAHARLAATADRRIDLDLQLDAPAQRRALLS